MNYSIQNTEILILSNVWPEPDSSAAGVHMMQLIEMLLNSGRRISYGSTAAPSERIAGGLSETVLLHQVKMNDPGFSDFLLEVNPEMVIFDRFMCEEQFSWIVRETLPDAVRILNTEDLHSLREYRRARGDLSHGPGFLHTHKGRRELAAIWRSDFSLFVSTVEISLLKSFAGVPDEMMHFLPLSYSKSERSVERPGIDDRRHFMSIGNFRHPPNAEAAGLLCRDIWPEIRKQLPEAELHLYGAYPNSGIKSLHKPDDGIMVKGTAENLGETLSRYRVMLAPLRYGAGIKGKVLESMRHGLPCVTTPAGIESICDENTWPLTNTLEPKEFANLAVRAYSEKDLWTEASEIGTRIIEKNFARENFSESFIAKLRDLRDRLKGYREANVTGGMLWHQSMRSTEFMSRWISLKEKIRKQGDENLNT